MRAKRSLGQNFLVDPNIQRKIVDAVEPESADTVVEIGPGHGALTDALAARATRLVAVELDDDLAAALRARFADARGVTIVHGDVLTWDPAAVLGRGTVRVVGNIPYNITSPILFRLLQWRPLPERIILMVQREVADRLAAPPGDREYGAMTVGVRAVADVERLFHVGRGAFRPVPNVDSTVLRIAPRPEAWAGAGGRLRSLTRAAFGLRRKQLQKILRTAPGYGLSREEAETVLAEVGLRPEDRPEVLDPPAFIELAAALERRGFPRAEGPDS
ncbi:MAG TPA: 16S rRNA (adenine(1518)-N(6)/adenine(1519)-N(6))-dimethyltransferase RsmA [Longimicrobiales bacterium]|nr:16S rRNA (adenine(1518)-N(6)/adenine(1519)-N(6))-dimethyltransferase RsmA [Longimicrobiales bacterium]